MSTILNFNNWLFEKVEYHNRLCPKIWDQEKTMHPAIRKKLLAIARDFWNALNLDVQILDIQLTGSLANYNWTNSSDLDVHIIIDFSEIDQNIELVRKALDGQRFIWNQRHPVIIKGHDVECYIQHSDEQHTSSGLYSILKDQWIVTPSWNPPQIDEKDISQKIRTIKSEFNQIKQEASSAVGEKARILFEYLERFKKKILLSRREGLAKRGEFSIENLVFKELRRDGTIESLIDEMSKLYSKIYLDK